MVECVQRKIVADLQKAHAKFAAFVEQPVFIEGMRRLMATHSDSPTERVTADARFHFLVMSRTCSRMSSISKIFCQPSLNKTGLARLLIL